MRSGDGEGLSKRVTIDFETRGFVDLKKTGAYKYSLDPLTRPTCLAVKVRGEKTVLLKFHEIYRAWEDQTPEFRNWWKYLIREEFLFCAHNAFFEKCIYENIMVKRLGWPSIPDKLYRCTAAKAAACALPRALDKAGEAMDLRVKKDYRGYAAMMATCKPTKQWNAWNKMRCDISIRTHQGKKPTPKQQKWLDKGVKEPPIFLEPEAAPQVFKVLYDYCIIDDISEEELDEALPDLIPQEQELWFLNQRINWRGLRVDISSVKKIVTMMEEESRKKLKELDHLTSGLVTKPGAIKSILEFLELEKIKLPNLRKQTVEDALREIEMSPDMKRLLELRKALSLASTRKYQAFLNRCNDDGRIRDILMFHGASTGRDTGTGIQPHNFPKGLLKVNPEHPYFHIDNIVECEPELLKVLYGESLAVLFSSVLRNMILPSEGYELFVGDYSLIEVGVCWWCAGNKRGLEIIRQGEDVYLHQAASNTGKLYESFNAESPERVLGKAQILGGQFGMGWEKFQKTAWDIHRLKLSDEQSKTAVNSYRTTNPEVPQLWKDVERAAINAVESPGTYYAGKCKFYVEDKFLVVELPSGRCLRYRSPQIAWRETDYGPRKTLEFYAVNSKTRKWGVERSWGGTLVENCVQAIARDIMMYSLSNLEKAKYRVLLTVHDEVVGERKKGRGSKEEFLKILCRIPRWGKGLPISAKGWVGPRYRK